MGNSRNWTTKLNARAREIEAALKANGITKNKRRKFISKAAAGRPPDLAAQARQAVADRRNASVNGQPALIAAMVKAQELKGMRG